MQKWRLISKKDISPSKWFPLEKRTYKMPNGKIVDDFYVTTIADVAMIVPITSDGKIVLVRQFKQGADEIMTQFPAGRQEPDHADLLVTAEHELEEETGIQFPQEKLQYLGKLTGFSTKATEIVKVYFAYPVAINGEQKLDDTENIELVFMKPAELEQAITANQIWCSQTIAAWEMVKRNNLLDEIQR